MPAPLPLRPHHLTCLFFYVGKGYSEAFIARMDAISALVRTAGTRVELTIGCDAICEVCPNRRADRCESEARMRAFDARALGEYGLKVATPYGAPELFAAMFARLDRARIERICGDCAWRVSGVCDPDNPPPWR